MIQQESNNKCCQHGSLSEIYLCITPECKLEPICCKLCLKVHHKQHEYQGLIPFKEVDKIESLSLSTTYYTIQILENQIQSTLREMKSLLYQIDVLKQLQEKPSIEILTRISCMIKNKMNYQNLEGALNDHTQLINNQLEKMINQIKFCQMENSNLSHSVAQKRYYDLGSLQEIGQTLYFQNKYTEAIEQLDKILQMDEKHQQALLYKCLSLFNLYRYKESIEYADRVIEINSQNTDVIYLKSCSLFKLKKHNEALIVITELLKISPNYPEASRLQEQIVRNIQNQ